jgi:hypothetical protein
MVGPRTEKHAARTSFPPISFEDRHMSLCVAAGVLVSARAHQGGLLLLAGADIADRSNAILDLLLRHSQIAHLCVPKT